MPYLDIDTMRMQSQESAAFAKDQMQLAHAQALEMEATRNAYALAISEREEQSERELLAQQQAMESMLSDVMEGVEEQEEAGITSVDFYASLMNAMQGGIAGTSPADAPTGGPLMDAASKEAPEVGQTIYGSRARPV